MFFLALIISTAATVLIYKNASAAAATCYWVGDTEPANWNDATHWSSSAGGAGSTCDGGVVPGSDDSVVFTSNVTNSATFDNTSTILNLTINAGYTGTITQSATKALTVSTAFVQHDGTFTTGDQNISIGSYTLDGGIFNAGASTITLTGNFTHTAATGTFNENTSTLNITYIDATYDFNTSEIFNNVIIAKNPSNWATVASGDTMIIAGTLTLTTGILRTGTFDARGDINQAAGFNGSTNGAVLDFGDNAVNQVYTTAGGTGPNIRFDNASDVNDSIVLSTTDAAFTGMSTTVNFGDANTVPITYNAHNLTVGAAGFTLITGTFNAPTTMTFSGCNFTHNVATGTYVEGTNTIFSGGGSTADFNSSETFNSVEINSASTMAITAGDTMIVAGTLTLTNGQINTGIVDTRGDTNQASTFDWGTATLDFGDNAVNQVYTTAGGIGPIIRFDNASDANDSVVLSTADAGLVGISMTVGFGDANTANFNYNGHNLTLYNSGLNLVSGIFNAPTTLTFSAPNFGAAPFTHTAATGVFNEGTTTVFSGYGITVDFNGSETFNNVTVDMFLTINRELTIASGDTMIVAGTLTLTRGSVKTGTVDARGDINLASGFAGGNSPLILSGAGDQSYSMAGVPMSGIVRLNKDTGLTTLLNSSTTARTLTLSSAAQKSGGLAINTSGTGGLTLAGATNNPNVTLTGGLSFGKTSTGVPALTMGSGTWLATGDVDFTNATLTQGTSTLNLNGSAAQSLTSASQTLNNLTVSNSSTDGATIADRLQAAILVDSTQGSKINFSAATIGSPHTITTTLTLSGGCGSGYITLAPQVAATTWYFSPPVASSARGVDVSYSNSDKEVTATGSHDGGNNTNWTFSTVTRYWVAPADSNWNNSSNWSASSGGAGGQSIPCDGDTVVFDGGSIKNASVDIICSVAQVNILAGYNTGTITIASDKSLTTTTGFSIAGGNFNSNGQNFTTASYSQNGGTFVAGASSITDSGDFTITAGTFTANTSTINFTATDLGHTIADGGNNWNNLIFNGTGGGWSFVDSTIIAGDLTMTAGTLSGTSSVTVNGGDVTGNGTIDLTGGTFLVDTTGNFGGATDWIFSNLTFGDGAGATTTTKTSSNKITTTSVATIATNQTLNAGDDQWVFSGTGTPVVVNGTLTSPNATFSYTGDGDTNVVGGIFGYLRVAADGTYVSTNTYTLVGDISIMSQAVIGQLSAPVQTFFASDKTIHILNPGEDYVFLVRSNGAFDPGTSTFSYEGTTNSEIANLSFYNLSLAPASGTPIFSLVANQTGTKAIAGSLTIGANATLDLSASDYDIDLSGNYTNNGKLDSRAGIITLNGSGLQTITAGGTDADHDFYNLVSTNASPAGVVFADSATISGEFKDITPSSKLTFDALSTYTIANINLSGQAVGTKITLVSNDPANGSLPARQWYFNVAAASPQASFVNVTDSDALGGNTIVATSSTNGGNNENWTFAAVPGAPTGISAVGGNALATVTFTAPVDDGGSPITGYTVTSTPSSITGTGAGSPIIVNGLVNGIAYTFTVHATNVVGDGPESSASAAITPSTVPGAPTGVSAVAGDALAIITFTPPVDTGGSVITGYTVTSTPGGITMTGGSSPIIITGLTNGTAYTFTVYATNANGDGPESVASASVTPTSGTQPVTEPVTTGESVTESTAETGQIKKSPVVATETAPATDNKKSEIVWEDFSFYAVLDSGNVKINVNSSGKFEVVNKTNVLVEIPSDIFIKKINIITISSPSSTYLMNLLSDKNKYQSVVPMPAVKGDFELKILIVYEDGTIKEVKKNISVDPQGYVYTMSSNYFGLGKKQEVRIVDAKVTLYQIVDGKPQVWNSGGKQPNPVMTNKSGEYVFWVEPGEYYLTAEKAGYKTVKTDKIQIDNALVIRNIPIDLKFKPWIWLILAGILIAGIIYAVRRKKRNNNRMSSLEKTL